jgi:hypothetical protein
MCPERSGRGDQEGTSPPETTQDLVREDLPVGGECIPQELCSRICRKGRAYGDSCISRSYTYRKGRGCACDAAEVCS